MKTQANRRGFTLIEMLVVIAILGILMAMMVPAAGLILKRARLAQAKSDAAVAVTVLMKYQAEYNRWPSFATAPGLRLTDAVWVQTMSPAPGAAANPDNFKRILFFEAGGGALAADGLHAGAFVDPWGQPFQYQVDLDRNGLIPHPGGGPEIKAEVIAWSAGPDANYDSWEDNAPSWE